jgi:FlaA1/EpsC-like NDP-sugar epimerase
MAKTLFMTGGTGMLGVTTIEQILLTENNWKVFVLYRDARKLNLLNKILEKYKGNSNSIELVQGDILLLLFLFFNNNIQMYNLYFP